MDLLTESAPTPPDRNLGRAGRDWNSLRAAALRWRPPVVPTLVVVPHPDDEVLSTGGLIAHLRRRGADVTVAAVTDGEAAYAAVDAHLLARTRRREQLAALERLGVPRERIHRLGYPDGAVADIEAGLRDSIEQLVADSGAEFVVAPWVHDHHTDHEACGRAARAVCAERGVPLAAGLFWAYHHTDPSLLALDDLVALDLGADDSVAKRSALCCHVSQTDGLGGDPILSRDDLVPAAWRREYFVWSPIVQASSTTSATPSSSNRLAGTS